MDLRNKLSEPAAKRLKSMSKMSECKLCLEFFNNPIFLASHNCARSSN